MHGIGHARDEGKIVYMNEDTGTLNALHAKLNANAKVHKSVF
jgi:hypothetical protein